MIFEVRVVAFAQRHAERLRPQTSHMGAWEELEINGPVWREEAVVGLSWQLQSCIRVCIQVKFAWERCWCHSNSWFWEPDKFRFAELRIYFVWATSAYEYAKASHQKEVGVSLGTTGNKGRQLHGHKCAWRIKPFSKHTSTFSVPWVVWPLKVERRTWGLITQTSTPGIWYPGRSRLTTRLARSSTFQRIKPSLATVFAEDKSLILMLLAAYVMKSYQCGMIQTEAPKSVLSNELWFAMLW
jgi:hypothetical protein